MRISDWSSDVCSSDLISAESKEHAMPTRNEIAMLDAARAAGITSRDELANFMGQLSHESGGFRTLEESFRYTRGIDQIPVASAFRAGRAALETARLDAMAGHIGRASCRERVCTSV